MRQRLWLRCEGHEIGEYMSQLLSQDSCSDGSFIQFLPHFLVTDEWPPPQVQDRLQDDGYQYVGFIGEA